MQHVAVSILAVAAACGCVFAPPRLSDTGLYSDVQRHTLATGVMTFEPNFVLWSDGAVKRRFILLPEGSQIDTSSADAWVFPVGTRLWKEFERDGRVVETRYLEKMPGGGWSMATYAWADGATDAWRTVLPVSNARGTAHDIPSQMNCTFCHGGTEAPLGFTAVQLAARDGDGAERLTTQALEQRGLLSHAVDNPLPLPDAPAATRQALGVLHANCSSCHAEDGSQSDLAMRLRLRSTDRTLNDTGFFKTALGHQASETIGGLRIYAAPGDPDGSLIVRRMSARGSDLQMPPIATENVDEEGLRAVRELLTRLPDVNQP